MTSFSRIHWPLDSARLTVTTLEAEPPHVQQVNVTRMKVDIHNHILPKEWPDLKEVGTKRDTGFIIIGGFVTCEGSHPPNNMSVWVR